MTKAAQKGSARPQIGADEPKAVGRGGQAAETGERREGEPKMGQGRKSKGEGEKGKTDTLEARHEEKKRSGKKWHVGGKSKVQSWSGGKNALKDV